jgi:predicted nucleic acid-binding protein
MNAVDTNILIYAHDPRDPAKQAIADDLIEALIDGALLWQVACEYIAASRKLEPFGYSHEKAWREISRLQRLWTTKLPSWPVMIKAEELFNRYSLSFWDAMLIAACVVGGVTCLYSEDFDGYANIDGLSLINPFKTP